MRPLLFAAASSTLLLAGCGERWTVLTASGPPSALMGKTSFAFSSSFTNVSIGGKTEESYLSDKDDNARNNWAGDKTGMHADMLKVLQSNNKGWTFADGGSADVAVSVDWTFVEPGVFTAVFNMPSQTVSQVSFAVGGTVVDKIELKSYQDADIYHPSSGQRLRNCAEDSANQILDFLNRANSAK